MTTAREDLLTAGLAVFYRDGFEGATVAAIRTRARASNGSFFHFFGSKKELAGTLFLEILARYHSAVIAAVDESCEAREGVARLIRAHLDRWSIPGASALCSKFPRRMDRGDPRCAARRMRLRKPSSDGARRWLSAANCCR
jgi:AcrR family transcriptional regulator